MTRNLYIFSLLIIVLIGTCIVFFLAKINYLPIKKLKHIASDHLKEIPPNLSDIETATYAIEALSLSNTLMQKQKQEIFEDKVLFKLLKGQYKNIDSFLCEWKHTDFILDNKMYIVTVLDFHFSCENESIINLANTFKTSLCQKAFVRTLEYLENQRYIFIISFDSTEEDNLKSIIHNFTTTLSKDLEGKITIGVGNPCTEIISICDSFQQALLALKYGFIFTNQEPLHYEVINSQNNWEFNYPQLELEALYQASINGNVDKVDFILSVIINMLKKQNASIFVTKCLSYAIINTLFQVIHNLNSPFITLRQDAYPFNTIEDLYSIDDVVIIAKNLASSIAEHLNAKSNPKSTNYNIDNIITYIQNNYTEKDICVGSIANHFNMSISNLSHFFKVNTKQNISDYINQLRFDFAKDMLTSTNLSINEIAEKTGYFQTSSFIRKFKQLTGVTPTVYRNTRL